MAKRRAVASSGPSALLFDPARLAQARRLRGLLKSDLAGAVEVTPAAISQFEAGQAKPSSATLARIAIALRVPVGFLARGRAIVHVTEDETNFRSLRSTTKRERSQARAQVELLAELVSLCEQYLSLPGWDEAPMERGIGPEDAAELLRDRWDLGVGPIGDMVGLLERRGALVARLPSDSARVDAFSCWVAERPYVLLASNKQSADRSRFDAAHELGHLVLHPDPLPGLGAAELEAHRFASAFLMPRVAIAAELPRSPNLGLLVDLKLRWRVSVQALLRRGKDIGLYSDASYRRAYQQLGARGWRVNEPGEVGPVERPTLLARAYAMLEARYGDDVLSKRTQLPGDELAKLLSMFTTEVPPVTLPENDDTLRAGLIRKLDPARFPGMSGKMAAIVGYVLEARFSDPAISELTVTSDGFVLAAREGDSGANELLGARADLNRNLVALLNATTDLTDDEIALFGRLQRSRITRW
jgi:Zn-dependent peptidase ImmA (M78 family)/transcriptional regulator with XRE-family HTH domain